MTSSEGHIPRSRGALRANTDVDDWIAYAKANDKVILLDADTHLAFVYHTETEDFDSGEVWISRSPDPESGCLTTAFCHENLIERRFNEAVSKHKAYVLEPEETPLRENEYVKG